jgi:hypothetical protein
MFGQIAGALIGAHSARSINKKQQRYASHMSNTAFQRQMADMKKAGLNPILAAGKGTGASTPNVPLRDPGESSRAGSIAAAQIGQIKASTAQAWANEQVAAAQQVKIHAEAANTQQMNQMNQMDIDTLKRMGLSPMQLRHTPINQLGSMAIDGAGNVKDWVGEKGSDLKAKAEEWWKKTKRKLDK